MNRIMLIIIALLVLASSAQAGELSVTGLGSQPHWTQCDGKEYADSIWMNPTGNPVYIKTVTLWIGMGVGSRADIYGWVGRISDSLVLHFVGWDHYADPTTTHQVTQSLTPDYVTIQPGDGLILHYFCASVNGQLAVGGIAAFIWFTIGAP